MDMRLAQIAIPFCAEILYAKRTLRVICSVAANAGLTKAQYCMGNMYRYGRSVGNDARQAVTWYRKASEQGHAGAMRALGELYSAGEGLKQDSEKAISLYRRAATGGDAIACHLLGTAVSSRLSGDRDSGESKKWLHLAADRGHGPALVELAKLHRHGRYRDKVQEAYKKPTELNSAERKPGSKGSDIVIWNTHHGHANNRGTLAANITLYRNSMPVWERKNVEFGWAPDSNVVTRIYPDCDDFTEVRISPNKFHNAGAGIIR